MPEFAGTPSDDVDEILAIGRTDVSTIFVSLTARDPDGRDLEYLEWHCYDHRPEQYRLSALRGALRLVSTPECRTARIASSERYDSVDHVMTYLFSDVDALPAFFELGRALYRAGRMPHRMPSIERAVFKLGVKSAAPSVKVGADVLPWWPSTGVLLLIERGHAEASALVDVPGVGGVWTGPGLSVDEPRDVADIEELQLTYCFLDDEPAAAADRLRPALEDRWANGKVEPLLAAPFHTLDPSEPGRYLP